jgi:hypothetical protein
MSSDQKAPGQPHLAKQDLATLVSLNLKSRPFLHMFNTDCISKYHNYIYNYFFY